MVRAIASTPLMIIGRPWLFFDVEGELLLEDSDQCRETVAAHRAFKRDADCMMGMCNRCADESADDGLTGGQWYGGGHATRFTGKVEGVEVTLTVNQHGINIKVDVDGETGGGSTWQTAESVDAYLRGLALGGASLLIPLDRVGLKRRRPPDTA